MPTRSSPSTSANSAHRISSCGRARRAPHRRASDPAPAAPCGRACRSASAADAPAPRTPPAPCSPAGCGPRCARSVAHRAPDRRRHHIGHQPLVARLILARNHRRLRHRTNDASAPPRSRQAQCGSRAIFTCCRHGPRKSRTPSARQRAKIPGAVHPAPRRHQTDPPQTAPPSAQNASDNPAPVPLPQCKAPPQPPPVLAQVHRPIHKHACSRSDADRRRSCAPCRQGSHHSGLQSWFRSARRR